LVPLTFTQKGAIGQFAFLATALATGKGQVEAYAPVADNEERDAEIRRHLNATPGIGIQVKVTFSSHKKGRSRAEYIALRFSIAKQRVRNDPRLWYFFAYYSTSELRLHDPAFLIPSGAFHALGRTASQKRKVWYHIQASIAANSNDRWSPYRVAPNQLGKRLLEIIDDAPLASSSRALKLPPHSILLGRARRTLTARRSTATRAA
jgi:hypothetical protein